jgi:hypothetical protein
VIWLHFLAVAALGLLVADAAVADITDPVQ